MMKSEAFILLVEKKNVFHGLLILPSGFAYFPTACGTAIGQVSSCPCSYFTGIFFKLYC